jgi:hypothetical protein
MGAGSGLFLCFLPEKRPAPFRQVRVTGLLDWVIRQFSGPVLECPDSELAGRVIADFNRLGDDSANQIQVEIDLAMKPPDEIVCPQRDRLGRYDDGLVHGSRGESLVRSLKEEWPRKWSDH